MQPSITRGIFLAVASALFYGQVPVYARLAYLNGVPGTHTIVARTLVLAVLLAAVSLLAGQRLRFAREGWRPFLLQCLATIAVSSGIILSVQYITATLAVIIFFTAPVIGLLLSPLIETRPLSLPKLALAGLAFAGLAIALGPEFSSLDPRGIALAAMAALGYVLQFYSGRALSHHLSPTAIGALVHASILPVVLALALTLRLEHQPTNVIGILAMLGVAGAYLMGYSLQMMSLASTPASNVVPFFNAEPIITALVATIALGEVLTLPQYAGAAIVLASLFLMTRLRN